MKIKFLLICLFLSLPLQTIAQLKNYFSDKVKIQQIKLPNELVEISGITADSKGNFYCLNDEQGIIFQIDINLGKILNKIFLDENALPGDYEDIVVVNDDFYLLRSDGLILKATTKNGKYHYVEIESGLSKANNYEGLYYDSENNSLLIACKEGQSDEVNKVRVVYKYSINEGKTDEKVYLKISLNVLKSKYGIKNFYPSAITKNSNTKTYYILSAKGKPAILEIDSNSRILDAFLLDEKKHPKPEGVVIYGNELIISDEGLKDKGRITIYKTN